jgi:hypothetical protein
MSFTQAMQGGQPAPAPQQNPLVAEMQQTTQAVQSLIQKLRQVPGINQATFEQGVQQMKQGIQMIASAMPQRQGQGAAPGQGMPQQ